MFIDSLLSFRLSDIKKDVESRGYSLNGLLSSFGDGDYITALRYWSLDGRKVSDIRYRIIKEDGGLFLDLFYSYTIEDQQGYREQRFNLIKKESNLLPGKSRYYIESPLVEGLSSTLYLSSVNGVVGFYPRLYLSKRGYIYKQQGEGHRARSVWSLASQANRRKYQDTKYRKSHYRGKITPFWKRYEYLRSESNCRIVELLINSKMIDKRDLL